MRVLLEEEDVLIECVVDILRADVLGTHLVLHPVELRRVIEALNHVLLHHLQQQLLEIVTLQLNLHLILQLQRLADPLDYALHNFDDLLVLLYSEDAQFNHVPEAHQARLNVVAVEPIIVFGDCLHDVLQQPLRVVLYDLLAYEVFLLDAA